MKNKLFITAVCISLMAFCSTAWSSDAISRFSVDTRLQSSRVVDCGNGKIDEDAQGVKEECEFNNGVEITTPVSATPVHGMLFPICDADRGETCNPDSCRCEIIPICGDGIWAGNAEQCEATINGVVATPEMMQRMCMRRTPESHLVVPWFTPPTLAEGANYVCNDCICATCGNGVVDPGEECDGGENCNSECKLAPPIPEEIKCSIKQYGALDEDYINELNAQVHAILGTDQIDLFGQEFYSRMVVQVEFPDTVIPTTQPSANIESSLLKSGNVNMTSTGIVLLGGPVMDRLSTMEMRPRKSVDSPLRLFPRGSGAAVNVGQSVVKNLGGEDVTILVPDLSSSFPEVVIESDLSAAGLGETDVTVVSANEAALNGVARFLVVPNTPTKSQGETVSKQVLFESYTWAAPPGFTGEQEVFEHDPGKVLEALRVYVQKLKDEGREDEIDCSIALKLDVPYESQMFTRAAIISDTLKVTKTAGQTYEVDFDKQQVQNAGFFSTIPISAAGGAGSCSLTGAEASLPQILATLGVMAVSLAGVGIVRRRKR